eukprot:COSAG05_NODE_10112_length_582_cov_1.171843_1_plen_51_part_10
MSVLLQERVAHPFRPCIVGVAELRHQQTFQLSRVPAPDPKLHDHDKSRLAT